MEIQASLPSPVSARRAGLDLFVISFGLLFLEQACIRWIPAHLRLLNYFSNFVLLAVFLGMGLGLLRPRSASRTTRPSWLVYSLPGLFIGALFLYFVPLNIHIESASFNQSIYFGAEAVVEHGMNVPFWIVLSGIFVVLALLFSGPGQRMGELFDNLPPLSAYSWNIGGSILGIVAFMAASALQLSPAWWFGIGGLSMLWLMRDTPVGAAVGAVSLVGLCGMVAYLEHDAYWSPYNRISIMNGRNNHIVLMVNNMTHQIMMPTNATDGLVYELPYAVAALAGRPLTLKQALVIGAGSGNDVSHMLKHGAAAIDAVEIDPRIRDLGRQMHPDRPYADPRVNSVIDDGRSFLRRSRKEYDLAVYALVDSLSLLTQFGAVRLENYLFTQQAFEQVRDHLAPDGVFVAYNFYREAWLAARIYRLLERVFGPDRTVMLTFPPRRAFDEDDQGIDLVIFMAGDVAKIRDILLHGNLTLAPLPGTGYPTVPLVGVSSLTTHGLRLTTDDWPFPYLHRAAIPPQNLQGIAVILGVSVLLLFGLGRVRADRIQPHFFLLGAAFMLIETEGIARLALLFGTTWINNSLTFLGILSLALLANLIAMRVTLNLRVLYSGLLVALALAYAMPLSALLGLAPVVRSAVALLLLFLPVFFAAMVFARSFRESTSPHQDLGSNILGALAGGCLENLSTVTGMQQLILVIGGVYLLSWVFAPRRAPTR